MAVCSHQKKDTLRVNWAMSCGVIFRDQLISILAFHHFGYFLHFGRNSVSKAGRCWFDSSSAFRRSSSHYSESKEGEAGVSVVNAGGSRGNGDPRAGPLSRPASTRGTARAVGWPSDWRSSQGWATCRSAVGPGCSNPVMKMNAVGVRTSRACCCWRWPSWSSRWSSSSAESASRRTRRPRPIFRRADLGYSDLKMSSILWNFFVTNKI